MTGPGGKAGLAIEWLRRRTNGRHKQSTEANKAKDRVEDRPPSGFYELDHLLVVYQNILLIPKIIDDVCRFRLSTRDIFGFYRLFEEVLRAQPVTHGKAQPATHGEEQPAMHGKAQPVTHGKEVA